MKGRNGQVQGLVLSLMDMTERERTYQALRQHASRLQLLHEIGQAILAAQSAEEIAETALPHVPRVLDCMRASVVLFDLEMKEMSLLAVHTDGETWLGKDWRGPMDQNWVWVLEKLAQGQTHTVEDMQDQSPSSSVMEALQAEGVRAHVYVPLIVQGKLIGSLNVGMSRPGPLTPEQGDIARELADQLAIGIQQARLHEQVQRHADELEQLVASRTAELWAWVVPAGLLRISRYRR